MTLLINPGSHLGDPTAARGWTNGRGPHLGVQFTVLATNGERHTYGDQEWVADGRALDHHPGGRVQHRSVTITYGPWVDAGAPERTDRSVPPVSRRWRACLAPLDKPTTDGRTMTGIAAWTFPDGGAVGLFDDDSPASPDPVGTVDRLTVEDGRIIAYGEVWDAETAEGMFSGRLRPEAGWVVPNELMKATAEDDGQQLRIVMAGGRLGYVKASSGPSAWPDPDDTWFAEDTTGGTS